MKPISIYGAIAILLLAPLLAQAAEITPCSGTVLQRRLALVQFGRLADAYLAAKGALPEICPAGISDKIPDLLKGTLDCSSSNSALQYSCEIERGQTVVSSAYSTVVETCRYSLVDQSVSCENRTTVTTFEESK